MKDSISKGRRKALKTVGALGAGLMATGSLNSMAQAEPMTHHQHHMPNNKLTKLT